MKKRILALVLVLCLTVSLIPAVSAATDASGTCGENVTWVLTDGSTLTISGTGPMTDYLESSAVPWYNYQDNIKKVVINYGVTTIGDYAFYFCDRLTSVTIPDGLTTIGDYAFYFCYRLTSVTIPDSVTTIGEWAFYYCTSLTSVTIPDSVTTIGDSAFLWCESLTSVTIPDSVTTIGDCAFDGCNSLTGIWVDPENPTYSSDDYGVLFNKAQTEIIEVPRGISGACVIPSSVTTIGEDAFYYCNRLTSVTIPDSVTTIGDYAFYYCDSLTSVTIQGSVTTIGEWAFYHCDSLTSVTLPDGLTTIGEWAFYHCDRLTSVTIPASVTYIGARAFASCENLYDVKFMGNAPDIDDYVFESVTATAYYPAGDSTWTEEARQSYGGTITWLPYTPVCPHSETRLDGAKDATCTENGYTGDLVCVLCGEVIEAGTVIPALGHDYRVTEVVPPTCTEMGYTTHTCTVCGHSYVDEETDPLGHDWDGLECTRCDATRENPFDDVPSGSFYEDAVNWAIASGITNGTSATTFSPNAPCNRAAVVTFLWRAAGEPNPKSTSHPFVDVEKGSFYEKAVLWAVENNITNGVDATHFGPTASCNRAQVVTFLYRAQNNPAFSNTDCPFTDVEAGLWYEAPILWAVEKGVTNGMGDGTFGINNVCNRAQVVTFLYRTYVN